MSDDKPFTIRTIRSGPPVEPTAPRVVYDFGTTYRPGTSGRLVHLVVWPAPPKPPTRFQQLLEQRHRINVACQTIDVAFDTALTIMRITGQDVSEAAPKAVEAQQASERTLADMDHRIALLLRPVCMCGWSWDDAPECPGCGEARAPDGRSVPTCEAELEAASDGERAMVRAWRERMRDRGMI